MTEFKEEGTKAIIQMKILQNNTAVDIASWEYIPEGEESIEHFRLQFSNGFMMTIVNLREGIAYQNNGTNRHDSIDLEKEEPITAEIIRRCYMFLKQFD